MRKSVLTACLVLLLLLIVGCASERGTVSFPPAVSSVSPVSVPESTGVSESEEPDEPSGQPESSEQAPSQGSESSRPFTVYRPEGEIQIEKQQIPAVREEGFSLSCTELTLPMGREVRLYYTFKPYGTTDRRLTWESSDTEILLVENGVLSGVQPGTATVTATTAAGRKASCEVTVTEEGELPPFAALLEQVSEGDPSAWEFCLYDLFRNQTKYLLVRKPDDGAGSPIRVYSLASGKQIGKIETGSDEEWGVWERTNGKQYILLSYTTKREGGSLYVLEELVLNGGLLEQSCVLARGTNASGAAVYLKKKNGATVSCTKSEYNSARSNYFLKNVERAEGTPPWVAGTDALQLSLLLNHRFGA